MSEAAVKTTDSLCPRIEAAAKIGNTVTFVGSAAGGKDQETIPWTQITNDACKVAAALQKRGVLPGDNVALLGLTSRPLITALQGVWLAGGCVSMLPIPMRMSSITELINHTRAHLTYSRARLLLIDPAFTSFYEPREGDIPVIPLSELPICSGKTHRGENYRKVKDDPDRLAILQFTSGSTAEPKGVMLPHRVVCANIDAMDAVVKLDLDRDVLVSWLPLYHDMGLIGILTTAMIKGCKLILAAPQDFLANPASWMRWMSQYCGTITAGPNFSYILATRALKRLTGKGEKLDLSPVRLALNGAEPIDPEAVEKFVAAASGHGFQPGAEFCAFGMAEVTIGGTFPPPMRGMLCDNVNREALEVQKIATPAVPGSPDSKRLPLLGSPLPGLKMRICDPNTGEDLPNRRVGELQISGTSVTSGYFGRPDLTETLLQDGWLRTGDLGYFVPGPDGGPPELVICGRLKDMIIVAGRNIYPEDIERAAGMVDGVRPGNVIAFGIDSSKGKEAVVVIAEIKEGDPEDIKKKIRYRVLSVCGVTPRGVILVQPGTLPKTSSGKLQRSLCRRHYKAGKY